VFYALRRLRSAATESNPSSEAEPGSGTALTTRLSNKKYVFGPDIEANGSVMPSVTVPEFSVCVASMTSYHYV
jgi:hypothetical protein